MLINAVKDVASALSDLINAGLLLDVLEVVVHHPVQALARTLELESSTGKDGCQVVEVVLLDPQEGAVFELYLMALMNRLQLLLNFTPELARWISDKGIFGKLHILLQQLQLHMVVYIPGLSAPLDRGSFRQIDLLVPNLQDHILLERFDHESMDRTNRTIRQDLVLLHPWLLMLLHLLSVHQVL